MSLYLTDFDGVDSDARGFWDDLIKLKYEVKEIKAHKAIGSELDKLFTVIT